MICRKITYRGNFDQLATAQIYQITRRNEINGEVKVISPKEVQLNLEGDASYIKLVQHQIEHSLKEKISNKEITPLSYQQYFGLNFIR